jgi:hypothetical protein
LQEVITIQDKAYKIGELAFEDLDKKFELHLALTHECLLAMQGQYGFQALLGDVFGWRQH